MEQTNHDYSKCIVGNYHDGSYNGSYDSWEEFKNGFLGFTQKGYDDTYHFVFRYDVHKYGDGGYTLELCIMLQRKGIYIHLNIRNITQEQLDNEISKWLKGRFDYIKNLWVEVND